MKTAIIGSRTLNPVIELKNRPELIISGGANGVDKCAEDYAKCNNIPILIIKPDYQRYNAKNAPIIRNKEIVNRCDVLIAYWDGKSKGTEFTIEYAKKQGKKVYIRTA